MRNATIDASFDAMPPRAPSRAARAVLAIGAALFHGIHAYMRSANDAKARDFDQLWYAARTLLAGRDPYAEIGPGLAFDWPAPMYYPLTAVVAVSPLSTIDRSIAAGIFAAIGMGLFVWAATRRSLAPAVVVTSGSAVFATETVQWSPLLGAAVALPWVGALLVAKPTIGVAMFVARPSRIAIVGGAALVAIALALQPGWPDAWLDAVRHTSTLQTGGTPYLAPVATPIGAIALLSLVNWRRPEARLVAALACVPQTPLLYETVPLFLVPGTLAEGAVLWAASWGVQLWTSSAGPYTTDLARFTVSRTAIAWLLYLPCVAMILRRPNEGALPAWIEALVARWPARLRGSPGR